MLGEPALVHYLRVGGHEHVEHVAGRALPELLEASSAATWIVTGRYARSSGAEGDLQARFAERLGTPLRFQFVPKDQRVYDDYDPWNIRRYRESPDDRYDLSVQRVAPLQD